MPSSRKGSKRAAIAASSLSDDLARRSARLRSCRRSSRREGPGHRGGRHRRRDGHCRRHGAGRGRRADRHCLPAVSRSHDQRSASRGAEERPRRVTAVTNVFTGRPARGIVNRIIRELGPMSAAAPVFPLALPAVLPLRAKAEPWPRRLLAALGGPERERMPGDLRSRPDARAGRRDARLSEEFGGNAAVVAIAVAECSGSGSRAGVGLTRARVPWLSVVVDPEAVEVRPWRSTDNRCGGSHLACLSRAKECELPKCL